jgi:type I restriction enzyme R subunit
MQTIARANRVFGDKHSGLIVDYIGIFRDLQKALAIYGTGISGGLGVGERPVESKDELIEALRQAIEDAEDFCAQHGIDLDPIHQASTFQRIALIDDAVEAIIVNDQDKDRYLSLAGIVDRLFKAILPDRRAGEFGPQRHLFVVLAERIRSLSGPVDISQVMGQVDDLLDRSVAAHGYVIRDAPQRYDLAQIDFDALRE